MKDGWSDAAKLYDQLQPPARPSKGDVRNFGVFLNKVTTKNAKVLSLGCTPELRNIFLTLSLSRNISIDLLDASKEMHKTMSMLTEGNNPKEKFIEGDWFESGLPDESYDIVTGDEVIVNVPLGRRERFFSEICRMLKPGGYFLTKHNEAQEKDRNLNKQAVKEQLDMALELKQTIGETLCNIPEVFYYYLAINKPGQPFKLKEIIDLAYQTLQELSSEEKYAAISAEFLRSAKPFEIQSEQAWIYQTREKNEEELAKFFNIIDRLQADDYLCAENKAVYLLQKK